MTYLLTHLFVYLFFCLSVDKIFHSLIFSCIWVKYPIYVLSTKPGYKKWNGTSPEVSKKCFVIVSARKLEWEYTSMLEQRGLENSNALAEFLKSYNLLLPRFLHIITVALISSQELVTN